MATNKVLQLAGKTRLYGEISEDDSVVYKRVVKRLTRRAVRRNKDFLDEYSEELYSAVAEADADAAAYAADADAAAAYAAAADAARARAADADGIRSVFPSSLLMTFCEEVTL